MLLAFLIWKIMADFQVTDKDLLTGVDRAADSFLMYDSSASGLKRTTVNYALDLTSHPVGINDSQTLTLKTLTSPNVSNPVLSGTVTGTYTLGGTPTFPSSVVTLTGSQTLTNKVLTSPTINTATIANPTMTVDAISEFSAATGVTIDGVLLKDSKVGANGVNTASMEDGSVTSAKAAAGFCVQQVSSLYSAVATGTTTIPLDDTIPQNTEGTEFMTCAITPKSSTNTLEIIAVIYASLSVTSADLIAALFQDSTANALAAMECYVAAVVSPAPMTIAYTMTAGTTSPTTFKVRLGGNSASTVTFNGSSGARRFGAIPKSSIIIREYKV